MADSRTGAGNLQDELGTSRIARKEGSTFTLTSTTTTTNKPTMMGMCQKGNMSQIEFLVVKAGTIWAKKLMK